MLCLKTLYDAIESQPANYYWFHEIHAYHRAFASPRHCFWRPRLLQTLHSSADSPKKPLKRLPLCWVVWQC